MDKSIENNDTSRIDLARAYLAPAMVICTIPFAILVALTAVAFALSGEIASLIICIAFVLTYAALCIIFAIRANDKDHYMTVGDEELTIKAGKGYEPFSIRWDDITEVVYYRMSSAAGWFNLAYSKVPPRSFFIKHKSEGGKELMTLGGHIKLELLRPIIEEKGLKLSVK